MKKPDWLRWLLGQLRDYFAHALGVSALAGFIVLFNWATDSKRPPLREFIASPSFSGDVFSALVMALLILSAVSLAIARAVRKKAWEYTSLIEHAKSFGVVAFSSHDTDASRQQDWEKVAEDITSASRKRGRLQIMCATGKVYFDRSMAPPVHEAIQNYEGEISVLLLNPKHAHDRAKRLHVELPTYQQEIVDSLRMCKTIAKEGKCEKLTVALYKAHPIWKVVMTPSVLWLQQYAKNSRGDSGPLFGFAAQIMKTNERSRIYEGFNEVFAVRFNSGKKVILERFDPASWERSC